MQRLGNILLLVCFAFAGERLLAEHNVSLMLGGEVGSLSIDREGESQVYTIGGIPINVGSYIEDPESSIGMRFGATVLVDFPNNQLSRMTGEWGFYYHLMGGPWREVQQRGPVTISAVNTQSFSLVLKLSYSQYSATSASNSDINISGSVLEARVGGAYSYQWSPRLCLDSELSVTALSFHSSIDRVQPRMISFLFGPRFDY